MITHRLIMSRRNTEPSRKEAEMEIPQLLGTLSPADMVALLIIQSTIWIGALVLNWQVNGWLFNTMANEATYFKCLIWLGRILGLGCIFAAAFASVMVSFYFQSSGLFLCMMSIIFAAVGIMASSGISIVFDATAEGIRNWLWRQSDAGKAQSG